MKIPGISSCRLLARRVQNRLSPSGIILLYHRITEVGSDPWSLCVSPDNFGEHLEVLQRLGYGVRLPQLNQTLKQVVVTFDDGYADNLYHAKPLLERYEIPATIFLTTGYRVQEREFWWDEIDRLLLQPGTLPEVLTLDIKGSNYSWQLGAAANYSEAEHQHNRHLGILHSNKISDRHSLYYSLYQLLYPLSKEERSLLIDQILTWAGASVAVRSTHRTLTQAEFLSLDTSELIEIGAHTVTHPFLATLSPEAQRLEIQESKAQLEEILGHSVVSFAYPHGSYAKETPAIVQELGLSCACSTTKGMVRRTSDRFALPRFAVNNWDGDEFAKWLSNRFAE